MPGISRRCENGLANNRRRHRETSARYELVVREVRNITGSEMNRKPSKKLHPSIAASDIEHTKAGIVGDRLRAVAPSGYTG